MQGVRGTESPGVLFASPPHSSVRMLRCWSFSTYRVRTLSRNTASRMTRAEISGWMKEAGLAPSAPIALPPDTEDLTVTIWPATRAETAKRSVA